VRFWFGRFLRGGIYSAPFFVAMVMSRSTVFATGPFVGILPAIERSGGKSRSRGEKHSLRCEICDGFSRDAKEIQSEAI
jgi:hypothetical protein